LKDTDGLDLRFGNGPAAVAIVEKIAKREGIGNILAEGTKRAAEKFGKGAMQYAIQIKGQELPMHEPRLKTGLGLGYMVSPTGADHCHNYHDPIFSKEGKSLDDLKTLGILEPLPEVSIDGQKVRAVMYISLWRHFANCVEYCQFVPWGFDRTLQIVKATTGWNVSMFELLNVARRAVTLARVFNVREGFEPADDKLPERIFVPFTEGAMAGRQLSKADYEEAKQLYYGMMGWDENGVPTKATLEELGIGWAHKELPA
jgi:aldehyde:ferredoxin oxidoreductase